MLGRTCGGVPRVWFSRRPHPFGAYGVPVKRDGVRTNGYVPRTAAPSARARARTRARPAPGPAARLRGLLPAVSRSRPRLPGPRLPGPRLTALGSGLFAAAAMALVGAVDVLVGGSATAYGVLFVPVSALAALWVRPADLFMAPIAAPLSFVAGLLVMLPRAAEGFGDAVAVLVTTLALQAGWVYGGTFLALGIAVIRRLRRTPLARRG